MNKLQTTVYEFKLFMERNNSDLNNAKRTLGILSLDQNVLVKEGKTMYKVVHRLVQQYIKDFFQLRADTLSDTSLRSVSNQNFYIPKPNISLFKNSLSYAGPVIWNTIPAYIKNSSTINIFTRNVVLWIANE